MNARWWREVALSMFVIGTVGGGVLGVGLAVRACTSEPPEPAVDSAQECVEWCAEGGLDVSTVDRAGRCVCRARWAP